MTNPDMSDIKKRAEKFYHPYSPYGIQLEFMTSLYDTLENYKVGIFESPTGTGKTLSLICASMTWLRDHKRKILYDGIDASCKDEPDWIKRQVRETKIKEAEDRLHEFETRAEQIRKIESAERLQRSRVAKRIKTNADVKKTPDDVEFLLADYSSDSERCYDAKTGVSTDVQRLLNQLSEESAGVSTDDEKVKIFFASRTHSQLSQFVSQLRLTGFPSYVDAQAEQATKHVALGSRKQLCINPTVQNMSTAQAINDACVDLQRPSGQGCEFLKSEKNPAHRPALNRFKESVVSDIRDIEDLADLGRQQSICPYYALRATVPQAEIITLPYQLLIQKESRNALGFDLRGSIVIIDEAHNLLDTISSIHSSHVSASDVAAAVEGLSTYFQKFSKRLNSGNRIYIQQLLASLNALDAFLGAAKAKVAKATAPGTAVNQNAIFDGTSADVVNFHKLRRYVDESKLAFKVDTYLEKSAEAEALGDSCGSNSKCSTTTVPSRPSRNVLGKVISFLVAITNPSNEGKLVFGRSPSMELQLEYILLDPSHAFRDVVEQARCVVLAGGTMQPVSDYTTYLFPYLDKTNIKLFSAGHVIPDENVKLLRIAAGPANQRFLFTFGNRENRSMTEDLGRTLINIARHTPQGLVIFFPSYQLLNKISATWRSSGLWDDLNSSKEIFQEPKSASDVDQVLTAYSKRIAEVPTGATLLSVVGGKMSEGINFSDGLARSVVMIGLPFPNLFSAEMIAKRQYVEQSVLTGGGSKSDATEVARDYYENVCMRAVNQSIGRAIRHASDYASIVLIDERYQSDRICNKLPTWLGASIMPRMLCGGLDMTQELDNFFLAKS